MTDKHPDASIYWLAIATRRREYLVAKRSLDLAVWSAHRDGVAHTLIASAYGCSEASVRDRLKRIRRDRVALGKELDLPTRDYS